MFKRVVVFTLSILMCTSISFADGREEVESMCTERWGSNQQMRDECIETQLHAVKIWFKNYFNKYMVYHFLDPGQVQFVYMVFVLPDKVIHVRRNRIAV